MARRLRVRRLTVVLGVIVVALGGVGVWAVSQGAGLGFDQPSTHERAMAQVRAQMGLDAEIRYTEIGGGRAVCGYAGRRGQAGDVAFVSRPNRILMGDDPLRREFNATRKRFCPGFMSAPVARG